MSRRSLHVASATLLSLLASSCGMFGTGVYDPDEHRMAVGIHSLKLKDGVTPAQFEAFVTGPFQELWKAPIGGVMAGIGKCDRGQKVGQYELAWFFDTVARRDAYFPSSEEISDSWDEQVGDRIQPVMDEFFKLCTRTSWTDYVMLADTPIPEGDEQTMMFGTHDLELREGVRDADFERFVQGEFAAAWTKEIAGLGQAVLKADRGENAGKYRIIYRFRPHTLRDRYLPTPTTESTEFREEVRPMLPDDVTQKFQSMARSTGYSDWGPVLR